MVTKHILLKAIIEESTKWYRNRRGASFRSRRAVRRPWVTGIWVSEGDHPHGQRALRGISLPGKRQLLTLPELANVWKGLSAVPRKQAGPLSPIWLIKKRRH